MSHTLAYVTRADLGPGHATFRDEWASNRVSEDKPLAQFHAKFWGKSLEEDPLEAAVQDDDGDDGMDVAEDAEDTEDDYEDSDDEDFYDDILPGCRVLDIGIDRFPSKIWIRADYIRIYKFLEAHQNKILDLQHGDAPSAVITGQPGIGKSVWVIYALCRRLSEKKSVILYRGGSFFLFVEEGVYEHRGPFDVDLFAPFVWTLVDADELQEAAPYPSFLVSHGTSLFFIYATFPQQTRWSLLDKTTSTKTVVMNPWTIKEILRLNASPKISSFPDLDPDAVEDAFDRYGPTPSICIDELGRKTIDKYAHALERDISMVSLATFRHMLNDMAAMKTNVFSQNYRLSLIHRKKRNDLESEIVVDNITDIVKKRLAARLRTEF